MMAERVYPEVGRGGDGVSAYPNATLYEDGYMTVDGGKEGDIGLFPVPDEQTEPLFKWKGRLFQVHPKYGKGEMLAEGDVELDEAVSRESNEDVAFVGSCGDIRFYVMKSDKCVRIAPNEYMFCMAEDCIGMTINQPTANSTWDLEGLLNERCDFLLEEDPDSFLKTEDFEDVGSEEDRKDMYPDDSASQTIMKMTGWLCHTITKAGHGTSSSIHKYGEKKVNETKESTGDISKSHAKNAERARKVSKATADVMVKISDKISHKVGNKVVKHVEIKEGDSSLKRRVRQLAASSMLSYAEVSEAFAKGYEEVLGASKTQGEAYMEKKYGANAKDAARHGTAAAYNVGVAALATRRLMSVRKIVKKNAKYMAKEKAQEFSGIK